MHMNAAIRNIVASVALACFVCAPAAYAQNTTLNFENLANPNNPMGFNSQGQSVTQNLFTVTDNAGGLFSVSPDSGLNYTGSVALFSDTNGAVATLTQNNGNIFGLNSIDIANLQRQANAPGGVTVVFTGVLQNGGTVMQTFTHGPNDNLETVVFGSDFSSVTSVSFTQNTPFNEFDNISVSLAPIPETSTVISLALLCISGIGFARKLRGGS